MKKHTRAGRWMERAALAGAAVCVGLALFSLRTVVIVGVSEYGAMLCDGGVWIMHRADFRRPEIQTTLANKRLDWWPPFGFARSAVRPEWALDVRLWFVALGFVVGAVVPRVARRVRVWWWRGGGRCVGCGFDMKGLGEGVRCPECGGIEGREVGGVATGDAGRSRGT